MIEKENRRTRITKTLIKNSLITLMQNQPIHRITIKEICENADINRSTFYSYYSNQYDLLQRIEDEIITETQKNLQIGVINQEESDTLKMLEAMLNYIVKNADVCKLLLGERGDCNFQKKLMSSVLEQFFNVITIEKEWDQKTMDYISLFAVSGGMGLIQNWMHNDLDKSPKEMAVMILKLTCKGIEAYTES